MQSAMERHSHIETAREQFKLVSNFERWRKS